MKIRLLHKNDAPAWRILRLRMLAEHPEAFGEHVDDFRKRDEASVEQMMLGGHVHGAFLDETLVGSAGWHSQHGAKRAHIGVIWGMYVAPEARSRGIGGALLDTMLAEIRAAGCSVAQLGVSEANSIARQLYESAGFAPWGREEAALCIDGRMVAEYHMWRRLD